MDSRFDAIIIDRNLESRMRLKQATVSVPVFSNVHQVSSFAEAPGALARLDRCDVIFISEEFPDKELTDFITQAKAERVSEDAAFIRTLRQKPDDGREIASQMVQGVDGFLFQPYSVNQLVEITRLAAKVKLDRTIARTKLALTLTLKDTALQLDLVASFKSLGYDPGRAREKLLELSASLQSMSSASLDVYAEVAEKFFGAIDRPNTLPVKKYSGASQRIKKRMAEKLAEVAEVGVPGAGES